MQLLNSIKSVDTTTIAIFILIVVISAMLYLNYRKMNEINALNCNCNLLKENLEVVSETKSEDVKSEEVKSENKQEEHQAEENKVTVAKNKLVMYYEDWCGWSQKFLQEWDNNLVPALNGSDLKNKVELVKVNCEKNGNVCSAEKVEGFPTVKLHKLDGTKIEFGGNRVTADIIKFLTENVN